MFELAGQFVDDLKFHHMRDKETLFINVYNVKGKFYFNGNILAYCFIWLDNGIDSAHV